MKIIRVVFFIVIFFGLSSISRAQNLIPNGSFEEFTTDTIPFKPKRFENLKNWSYFTTNRTTEKPGLWVLKRNSQNVYPDGGIVELYFRNFQRTTMDDLCKVVFMVQLNHELKKDTFYRLSYNYQIRSIGSYHNEFVNPELVKFFVRKDKLKDSTEIDCLQNEKPIGMFPGGKTYGDYYGSPTAFNSSDFRARGGEKYFVFGIIDTVYTKIWTTFDFDGMKLVKIDEKLANIKTLEVGNTIVIENILFEINNAILKPSSFIALNQLADELKQYEKLKIQISGHTDNVGTDKRNNELSEQRAKAVVDYLITLGVSYKKLSYKGYGSSNPIADNNTEVGRKQNRRVEITVLEK